MFTLADAGNNHIEAVRLTGTRFGRRRAADSQARTAPAGCAVKLDPKESREVGYYFALSQAGLEMVVPLGIGLWLDYQFGWSPWGLIVGTILGFVGGTVHLIVMANRIAERQSRKNDP